MISFFINKKKEGSVLLVFALIITTMALVVSVGLISVSNSEIKTSFMTDKSTIAVQVADTGIERVMKEINDAVASTETLTDVFGGFCAGGEVTGNVDPDGEYVIYFFNDSDVKLNCDDIIGDIAKIKSIGTYKSVSRAMDMEI